MKKRIYKTAAACMVAAVLFSVPAKASPVVSAQRAILVDAESGRVLWDKQADEPSLIASTTKIMTGLLIAEDCSLEENVVVSADAVGIEGSTLNLKAGEQRTVEELLYGMMLHSGNDAAAALAIHHAGSISEFVSKMNEAAAQLGMTQTNFVNPHGLDAEKHYSTARDLAKLTVAAMKNPVFYQVVSTKSITFKHRSYTNHNKLLWQYEGAVGVKTGYTKKAGRILVSCAERDNRRLVAVTICAPDDWNDHKSLFEFGFSRYIPRTAVEKYETFGPVSVFGGTKDFVEVYTKDAVSYPLLDSEHFHVELELPKYVYAPVLAGDRAGTAIIFRNEEKIGCVPLYWRETIWEVA